MEAPSNVEGQIAVEVIFPRVYSGPLFVRIRSALTEPGTKPSHPIARSFSRSKPIQKWKCRHSRALHFQQIRNLT